MTARPEPRWNAARILALCLVLMAIRLALYAPLAAGNPVPALCRWDCGWYASISTWGYRLEWHPSNKFEHPWVFFPVLPLLMRLVQHTTALSAAGSAAIVASACTLAAGYFGARYRDLTRPHARTSTWLFAFICIPSGFYFTTGYTEAPFAALAFATLLGLANRSAWGAASASALLSATRATGIWLVPSILALRRDRIIAALRTRDWRALASALLPAVVGVLGLLVWMAWLAIGTGDPLAFAHAQAAWYRSQANPFHVLATSLDYAVTGRVEFGGKAEAFAALFGLVASYALAVRRRFSEAILLAATVLTALASGMTASMVRYVGASPVVLLLFADAVDKLPTPRMRAAALAGSTLFQLFLVGAWFRQDLHFLV